MSLYYPYQEKLIKEVSSAALNYKTILVQSETGSGKTRCFCGMASSFLKASKQDVIIFVDDEKIFAQTRKTLLDVFQIDSDTINSKSTQVGRNSLFGTPRVFVAMVETFDRRSSRDTFINQIRQVGMVIVDECHMGNFVKIFPHFPFSIRIGFTATPLFSNKKHAMRDYYETLICGPKTSELIQFNQLHPDQAVVQDLCMRWKNNIDRSDLEAQELALGYKGEDHNQDLVAEQLSGDRQIKNTIDAYIKNCPGKKVLCFNANVRHSLDVTAEMVKCGLNARHIDGNASDSYREEIFGKQGKLGWLATNPNAILCNVGMTTKGFDEPSVEGIILNTMTKSITKFRQMCGRGARPYQYPDGTWKRWYWVLDMCDNIIGGKHGQWSDDIDWKYLFDNPKMPKPGVAPSKECPECGYICAASARKCQGVVQDFYTGDMVDCGYEFPLKVAEENSIEGEMIILSKNVDVSKIINFPKFQSKGEYFTFHETVRACAFFASTIKVMDRDEFEKVWETTYIKIVEWQRLKGAQRDSGRKIQDTKWFTTTGRVDLLRFLRDYGVVVDLEERKDSIHHLTMEET